MRNVIEPTMANCKICGRPVVTTPVMHDECLEHVVTEVAEQFCDNYCRWPLTSADLLDEHCRCCPMDRIMKLVK